MKKFLTLVLPVLVGSSFAKHYFNICYYNWANHTIKYNNFSDNSRNDKQLRDNFKDRGTEIGEGELLAGQKKCFTAPDETIFQSHMISFIVDNQLFSVVNPPFSKPYVIAQNATKKAKGKIGNKVDHNGHDQYYLNLHVMNDSVILSTSSDPKDISAIIEPAIR